MLVKTFKFSLGTSMLNLKVFTRLAKEATAALGFINKRTEDPQSQQLIR